MTKRRPRYDGKKFTPEIIDTYQRARKLYDAAETREALDLTDFRELQRELNVLLDRRQPWLTPIFSTVDTEECPYPVGTEAYLDWPTAMAVRQALDDAIAE